LADGEITDILPKIYATVKRTPLSTLSGKTANQVPRQRRDVIRAPAGLLGDDDATSYAFNSSDEIPVNTAYIFLKELLRNYLIRVVLPQHELSFT